MKFPSTWPALAKIVCKRDGSEFAQYRHCSVKMFTRFPNGGEPVWQILRAEPRRLCATAEWISHAFAALRRESASEYTQGPVRAGEVRFSRAAACRTRRTHRWRGCPRTAARATMMAAPSRQLRHHTSNVRANAWRGSRFSNF